MNILIACFSMTDNTQALANAISTDLERRGHTVTHETIKRTKDVSWFREVMRDIGAYPNAFTRMLINADHRTRFLKTYKQVEEDIQPLQFPDVSEFDRVIVGGPKWVYMSYPVARYLSTIKGIEGKDCGGFATFCGPPIHSFELEMITSPMKYAFERRGATMKAFCGITSAHHDAGLRPAFSFASRVLFDRPIEEFLLGTSYADRHISDFCDQLGA